MVGNRNSETAATATHTPHPPAASRQQPGSPPRRPCRARPGLLPPTVSIVLPGNDGQAHLARCSCLEASALLQPGVRGVATMHIFVKSACGPTLCLEASSSDTVDSLERQVAARTGGAERLVCAGKQLFGNRTLADYNLQDGSTVFELLRLRGGGVSASPNPALALFHMC